MFAWKFDFDVAPAQMKELVSRAARIKKKTRQQCRCSYTQRRILRLINVTPQLAPDLEILCDRLRPHSIGCHGRREQRTAPRGRAPPPPYAASPHAHAVGRRHHAATALRHEPARPSLFSDRTHMV
jgi:hypothetical protein